MKNRADCLAGKVSNLLIEVDMNELAANRLVRFVDAREERRFTDAAVTHQRDPFHVPLLSIARQKPG